MNVSVLGSGGWGTALALLLNKNGHSVTLWANEVETVENIVAFRENKNFLPAVTIPLEIHSTFDMEEAISLSKVIVFSVPVQFLRNVLQKINLFDLKNKIFCNTGKGVEISSLMLPSQIIKENLSKIDSKKLVTLSGPSHAEEVARNKPTNVVSASFSIENAKLIQKLFSNNSFNIELSGDILGVELGAALKNIIAIAVGICDGYGFGDNTKSGILIKGLNQISALGVKMGAKKETFYGLSGLGDLMVTCYSRHSRNHYLGEELGRGKSLQEITHKMKMVVEGVATTKSAYKLMRKYRIKSSLVENMYHVLYEHKSPHKAILDIMSSK